MTSPRERPPVGSQINGWRITEDDLQGRVGWVFIVCREERSVSCGRRGAPTLPATHTSYALKMWRGDQTDVSKKVILQEAARIRSANLPAILPEVLETGEWNGRPYFVMERLDDIDWPLPDKTYRRVAIEAFEALALLHGRQLLHCDITTRHLALKNGKVALLDLDNARTFEEALSNRDSIGTDPYIAPEVASRGELSPQSDIYSLAYVLRQHCPGSLLDTLDPVFRIALDPDPSKRPRTAADCAALLRTAHPPHHKFKAVVNTLTRIIILLITVYGLIYVTIFICRVVRLGLRNGCTYTTAQDRHRDANPAPASQLTSWLCSRRRYAVGLTPTTFMPMAGASARTTDARATPATAFVVIRYHAHNTTSLAL